MYFQSLQIEKLKAKDIGLSIFFFAHFSMLSNMSEINNTLKFLMNSVESKCVNRNEQNNLLALLILSLD